MVLIKKFMTIGTAAHAVRGWRLVMVVPLLAALAFAGLGPNAGLAGGDASAGSADDKAEQTASPLVPFEVVDNIRTRAIPKPLTDQPGDVTRGEALMVNRKLGNCIACHHLTVFEEKAKTEPNKYGDMGEVGPTLDGAAVRYDEGQLRLLVVNAKEIFPDTIMPSFYRVRGFERVLPAFDDKPILEAQDVEDIVSFLKTLK